MKPLDLSEFAQSLRLASDTQVADFAEEILELVAGGERLEFLESEVVDVIEKACDKWKDKPDKAAEWLVDREQLLSELEDTLDKAGFAGDVDDALDNALAELESVKLELAALKAPAVILPDGSELEYDL